MKLIEMFLDLAVHCGLITKFLLSTACALFFTLSTNFMVGAANGCREVLVEEIGLERVNIGTIHFVALSRPFLLAIWQSGIKVSKGVKRGVPGVKGSLGDPRGLRGVSEVY